MERFREIYTEWQESGQSVRTYAASIGMKEAKFYYWQSRLKKSPCVQVAKKTGGFVQMKPAEHPPMMTHQVPALCEVVYSNGVTVRITSDLSLEELRSLITLSK